MRKEELMQRVEARVEELMKRLMVKQDEYAEDEDCLAQFRRAGELQGCSPERALFGMVAKQIVALYNLARNEECSKSAYERWDEYIGDIVVYMLILGAMAGEITITVDDRKLPMDCKIYPGKIQPVKATWEEIETQATEGRI